MRVRAAARTDTGRRRSNNEDALFVDEGLGLFVVADGLGGHASGEVASRLAMETIREQISAWAAGGPPPPALGAPVEGVSEGANHLVNTIRFANQVIHGAAGSRPQYQGMATTVVAALVLGRRVALAHVGIAGSTASGTGSWSNSRAITHWCRTRWPWGSSPRTRRPFPPSGTW